MNLWIRFLSVLSFFLLAGSGPVSESAPLTRKSDCLKVLKQGIQGRVIELVGNHMPSPSNTTKSSGAAARRTLGIFELTKENQTEPGRKGGFYKNLKTRKIKSVCSGKDGCFAVRLRPGHYSLFVKEGNEWYANSITGDGDIMEVIVKEGEVTPVEIRISHRAVF